MATYNKQTGLPAGAVASIKGNYGLRFSRHSLMACLNDRYGQILPPKEVSISEQNTVEIETAGTLVSKVVIRQPYNPNFDLVMVIIPENGLGFVKTVWLNAKNDNHATLKKENYDRF